MQDNFIKIGNIIYNINYIESIKFSEPALMLPHEDFLGSVQNYKYVEVITKNTNEGHLVTHEEADKIMNFFTAKK